MTEDISRIEATVLIIFAMVMIALVFAFGFLPVLGVLGGLVAIRMVISVLAGLVRWLFDQDNFGNLFAAYWLLAGLAALCAWVFS